MQRQITFADHQRVDGETQAAEASIKVLGDLVLINAISHNYEYIKIAIGLQAPPSGGPE